MKIKFPPFLKKSPFEIFERFQLPVFFIIIIGCIFLRAWQFGKSDGTYLTILFILGGFLFLEILLFALIIPLGGTRVSQFARLTILYLAFVPKLKIVYLRRIMDIRLLFEIREDLTNGRIKNAIALWYPELTKFLLLMIPFIIILIMAFRTEKESLGAVRHLRKGFVIWGAVAVILGVMGLFFGNFANLGSYMIGIILVSFIWKLWEQIRVRKSYEPMPVVAWAETLLFLAMLLKGIVECF